MSSLTSCFGGVDVADRDVGIHTDQAQFIRIFGGRPGEGREALQVFQAIEVTAVPGRGLDHEQEGVGILGGFELPVGGHFSGR